MHRRAVGRAQDTPIISADTIAAISTPPGEGAIAVVRLSGLTAIEIADSIFRGKQKPSACATAVQHLGEMFLGEEVIDQVVLSVHRSPQSYTGEDLIEISCHGGMLVTARVLAACLKSGARAARPGEFTERAYLNGKMDLTQAEAVIDLIRANTDLALRAATEQLEGKLGERFREIRDDLVVTLAHVDAGIDFPAEGIAPDEGENLATRIEILLPKIRDLIATENRGRILREGVRIVIYGPTNAGKSSLLNRLLGYERAIVSAIPGTTRDTLEESINLGGVAVRLQDTAGLRATSDELESAGVMRTHKALGTADVRLLVVDVSAARPAEVTPGHNTLLILNKCDLAEHADWQDERALRISCVTAAGFDSLERAILASIGNLQSESAAAVNARHAAGLRETLSALERARDNVRAGISAEYVALDLREAISAIETVIGESDDEAVRDAIFSQFCIGK